MKSNHLLTIFDSLPAVRVLVLGDLILDRYTWGDAERVSQEAPVILLKADRREDRLGGAANVCQLLRGLEAEVTCAGVLGDDAAGQKVRRLLQAAGVDDAGVLTDRSRPTTRKERFIGRAANRHGHQILRVDTEVRDPLSADMQSELSELLKRWIGQAEDAGFQVVLVSDYDKGVCTPGLLARVIAAARAAGVPVVVDPIRGADYSRYRGATTMTPNRLEAGLATGGKVATLQDAYVAGRRLCDDLDLQFAVVTLDRDGMALVERVESRESRVQSTHLRGGTLNSQLSTLNSPFTCRHFPTRPRDVYDITGAGDMVLATIGVCLAAGVSPADAVRLGNVTGGLEVEKEGVVVIHRDEIRRDLLCEAEGRGQRAVSAKRTHAAEKHLPLAELLQAVAAHRADGETIVLTNGCFDLLHVGHLRTLEEAARQGEVLVVAVNSDESIRRLKGPDRPIIGQADRLRMLAALAMVDYVVLFDEPTPVELIKQLRPDVLVKGGTYTAEQVVGHQIVTGYGGRVHLARPVDGVSTTHIVNTLTAHPVLRGPHRPSGVVADERPLAAPWEPSPAPLEPR
jgi:D-beta-D-heptose 7-phosphate kinase/D-beta-D-heptose 1-phosphate adenosyltransferase